MRAGSQKKRPLLSTTAGDARWWVNSAGFALVVVDFVHQRGSLVSGRVGFPSSWKVPREDESTLEKISCWINCLSDAVKTLPSRTSWTRFPR